MQTTLYLNTDTDNEAWDCNPFHVHTIEEVTSDLDEEDAEGDWQQIVLDRFHDRLVTG